MTDLSDLEIAWTGGNEYEVLSPPTGESEATTAYTVNLTGGSSCTCKHGAHNDGKPGVCKHIEKAILVADPAPDIERAAFQGMVSLWSDAQEVLADAESARNVIQASQAAQEASQSDGSTGGSSDGDGAADDESVIVDGVEPTTEENGLREQLKSWFNQAAGFNGFDGEIISLTVKEVAGHADKLAGERVIEVDRQPFSGDYHEGGRDGDWIDKDGFDDHKEAVGDSILSPRDEFQYFGEPDYSYVIPVDDVEAVV